MQITVSIPSCCCYQWVTTKWSDWVQKIVDVIFRNITYGFFLEKSKQSQIDEFKLLQKYGNV